MRTLARKESRSENPLEHNLRPHFEALARFDSTRALESSALYARLRPEIERVLGSVETGEHAPPAAAARKSVRATAWNIERGAKLGGIAEVLGSHPVLSASDVLLLTELDYGMARSRNRHVARELAGALGMSYAFAPCYIALSKGSGLESEVEGENEQSLHGNAVLSRWPVRAARSVALPNGKDKMRGREKRLGSQRAVVCDVEHPSGAFRAVSLHLDAHSSQRHRARQMGVVLDFVERLEPRLPVLVGGDWNTTTYDSSRAAYTILGFFRRVAMGPGYFIRNHYLRPESWFDRHVFRELERRGYEFRTLNEPGAGTLFYDVKDLAAHRNLAEWVPKWCFWFLERSLREHGGQCRLKLDWFAGRRIEPDPRRRPRVITDLRGPGGEPLSDHDPIVLDFLLG
ncbi:MAG TPA: endonuclease/exonuclease/phosphatase family protein [Pyrinomonadaceae bacterium]|nr:endonuclease/exonuclease/phosphatase family protein [Pyrinomonadaceae bacterium]